MKTLDYPIAVIAGGLSTRFGSQKLDYLFRGTPLIEHALNIAAQISDDVYIVKGKMNINLDKKWKTLEDLVKDCGPIGGIYTALKLLKSDWLAVMPADMPNLKPHIYDVLNQNRQLDRPVAAVSEKGVEPLISIWPANALKLVEKRISEGKYKLNDVLMKLNAIEVVLNKVDENIGPDLFLNINSLPDLDQVD